MRFEIEVNGRVRTVSVEPEGQADGRGGRFHVLITEPVGADGMAALPSTASLRSVTVDARATDVGVALLYLDDARSVDVAVTERGAGDCLVQLPHASVTALVDVGGRRVRRPAAGGSAATGEQRITAPMPGRVLRVLVNVGDEVAAGQGVLVMEAMKMENALTATRAGRVRDIGVAEGASVESGRVLLTLT